MKRFLTLFMTTIIAVTLAACGNSDADNQDHSMHENTDEVHPLEVELTVASDIQAGEAVEFKAHVYLWTASHLKQTA